MSHALEVAPAELFYGRLYKTRLPDMHTDPASIRPDIIQARERGMKAMIKQKVYKDAKSNVKILTSMKRARD